MKTARAYFPLDVNGMDSSRPLNQVAWRRLTNVLIDDGWFVTRPGLRPVGPPSQDTSSRAAGVITFLREAVAWGDEDSSVGSQQVLIPNATIANTGWTITGAASVHAALDEAAPDDATTKVRAVTSGSTMTLDFASLSPSAEFIDTVILHFRAVATKPAKQKIFAYYGNGALDGELIGSVEISNCSYDNVEENVSDGYMDFFLPVPVAQDGYPWIESTVNAFQAELVMTKEEEPGIVLCAASTTGQDDDWLPAGSDSWKGTEEYPMSFFVDYTTTVRGSAGDRLSIQFEGLSVAMSSIDSVDVRFALANVPPNINGTVTVYHVGTDAVRRNVATGVVVSKQFFPPDEWFSTYDPPGEFDEGCQIFEVKPNAGLSLIDVEVTTNPETSAAFTPTEVSNGLEFGVEIETGSPDMYFSAAELFVEGPTDTEGVDITQVNLYAAARQTSATTQQIQLGRIMGTTRSFQRLNQQSPEEGADLVDILDSATQPSAAFVNWDVAEFFGSLYIENSINDTYVYGGSDSVITQLTTGLPLGHTIWSFAQRLFKADTILSGTRTIKRVAWTALADPDDWTGATSGDLDLTHGGEGRVRKGLPLSSHVSAVYLDKGVYTIRWTGDDDAPFVPILVDSDTGIVAPRSCLPILDQGGQATHLFFGRGPQGLGVYMFNGTNVDWVSQEIDLDIKELTNRGFMDFAFAGIERQQNLYVLFVPEGDDIFPRQAWVFHLDQGRWTRWEFPFGITCAGEWTLVRDAATGSIEGDPYGVADPRDGVKTMVLGTELGVPFFFDYDQASDWLTAPGPLNFRNEFFTSRTGNFDHPNSIRETPIDFSLETGAMVLGEKDLLQHASLHRVWMEYEDRGRVALTFDVSRDGGVVFSQTSSVDFGFEGWEQKKADSPTESRQVFADLVTPTAGRELTLRIRNNQTDETARQRLKISKLLVEYETGSEF